MSLRIDPALLAGVMITLGLTGCQQNVTAFKTLADASSACYAWREKGKKLSLVSKEDPQDRGGHHVIVTSSRACRYDSSKNAYFGFDAPTASNGITTAELAQAQELAKEFRVEP